MRTIILMRHGKSSWKYDVSDRERPLNNRGKADAKLVAKHFMEQQSVPQNIFSSPAKRALSTCKIFLKHCDLSEKSFILEEELYDFGGEHVINFIKNLPDSINEILIFGHNHAFTSFPNIFGSTFIDNLPTSGLVKITFDANSWRDIKSGHTELILIPKKLK